MLLRQSFHCSRCVAREEFVAKMPTRCVAGGCSNTPDLEKGIAPTLFHILVTIGHKRKKDEKSGWTL